VTSCAGSAGRCRP